MPCSVGSSHTEPGRRSPAGGVRLYSYPGSQRPSKEWSLGDPSPGICFTSVGQNIVGSWTSRGYTSLKWPRSINPCGASCGLPNPRPEPVARAGPSWRGEPSVEPSPSGRRIPGPFFRGGFRDQVTSRIRESPGAPVPGIAGHVRVRSPPLSGSFFAGDEFLPRSTAPWRIRGLALGVGTTARRSHRCWVRSWVIDGMVKGLNELQLQKASSSM